jgi:hypothetical protein
MFDSELVAEEGEVTRAIREPVVGEQGVHADTEAGVVVERGDEERHKRKQLFSLGQMAEKAIRECVDGDMHHPQPMPSTLSRRSPVTRCEGWGDMAQFLDVEMQEVAERGVLLADDRHSGLDFGHAIELEPAQNAADGGATESGVLGNAKADPALASQSFDPADGFERRGLAQPLRTRAAIAQAGGAFAAIAAPCSRLRFFEKGSWQEGK